MRQSCSDLSQRLVLLRLLLRLLQQLPLQRRMLRSLHQLLCSRPVGLWQTCPRTRLAWPGYSTCALHAGSQ